jgi:hypothetical protein
VLGGGRVVDVSAGDVSGVGPEVQGVMGVSADGSHVYFVARGVLAGANVEGKSPVEDADNLYVYERDAAYPAGRMVFIATLPGSEESKPPVPPETRQWTEGLAKAANVSVDGGFLLFTSHGALTGGVGGPRGFGLEQVYRYDAGSGRLSRVSIGEHGFDDDGAGGFGSVRIVAPAGREGQPRRDPSMSDDGSTVFFQSPVGLTARALNDVAINTAGEDIDLAQNVYEWEAPESHGCSEPEGCIYLVSDGQDASEVGGNGSATFSSVELLGTDSTGENVFFTTADRLVPGDTDSELDFYDARVDGGFPAPTEPHVCVAEECHEAGPEAGVFGALPSETLTGPGNVPPGSGHSGPPPPPPKKRLTRAQLLARALAGCRRDRAHRKRVACEREAHKRYGPPRSSKAKTKASGRRSSARSHGAGRS